MDSQQALQVGRGTSAGVYSVGSKHALRRRVMEILGVREELVLRLRFGNARTAQTRQAVARLLGVSDGTVRRIEREALRKLRLSALGPISEGWRGWDEV
jgi:DNA-directed RNA polymerase sigma subunit (sigma70/sigma32)